MTDAVSVAPMSPNRSTRNTSRTVKQDSRANATEHSSISDPNVNCTHCSLMDSGHHVNIVRRYGHEAKYSIKEESKSKVYRRMLYPERLHICVGQQCAYVRCQKLIRPSVVSLIDFDGNNNNKNNNNHSNGRVRRQQNIVRGSSSSISVQFTQSISNWQPNFLLKTH